MPNAISAVIAIAVDTAAAIGSLVGIAVLLQYCIIVFKLVLRMNVTLIKVQVRCSGCLDHTATIRFSCNCYFVFNLRLRFTAILLLLLCHGCNIAVVL